jgi:hypothetical protein
MPQSNTPEPLAEATSNLFVAHLGEATPEVEARLLQWAAGCVEHGLVRDAQNHASLYFARAESRTVRQMQSLIRTLSSRWKLPLGRLAAGWLQAVAPDEFREAVPAGQSTEGAAAPTRCAPAPDSAEGIYLESLPPDFGVRSHALLASLRVLAVM